MDDPTPSDQVSLGDYPNGTVFRLVRGIRGSSYSVGDRFMLIAEEDCHSPNTLKLGGMGEGFFIDPAGQPLKIEADESQFRVIFEAVVESPPPEVVLTEGETVDPDPKLVTEEKFSEFRKGLAGVLTEIAAIRTERGERGPRGYTGVQGDRGERGEPGPKGEDGAVGAQGEPGPQGEVGPQGPQGPQGERGQRGEPGARGADGTQGTVGPMGPQGPQGERGPQGAPGVAGPMGPRGEAGTQGIPGKDGADGKDGTDGRDGKTGKAGPRGPKGDRGPVGARGEAGPKGDRGSTGESGVLTAKFPLVYDAEEKSIAIDEERLDKILKKIMGGGKVSPQDMGWLASTGGGGKVAVYINGAKVTPDVRTLDFSGAGVSYTKVGGKVTVNISSTGGGGVTGPTGPTGPAGAGVAGNNDVGVMYLKNNSTATTIGAINQRAIVAGGVTTGTLFNFQKHASTNSLQYLGTGGKFHIVATFNFTVAASQNTCGFYVGKNTNISSGLSADADRISESEVYITCPNQSDAIAGAIQTIVDLNTNDRIFFIVQNRSAAKDITVEFLKFVAVPLTSERGATGATGATPTDYVASFNGVTGAVEGVCAAVAGTGISVSGATGTVTITNTGVQSFNGVTGAVQGVSSWNGQTGAVSFTNYVSSVDGVTGAITNVAYTNDNNLFTAIQIFQDGVQLFGGKAIEPDAAEAKITFGGAEAKLDLHGGDAGSLKQFVFTVSGVTVFSGSTNGLIFPNGQTVNSTVTTFNGLSGAVQGVSSFNGVTGSVHAVTQLQGKSGPIGVCGGRGINIPNRITGTGNTFAVSLNYLSGGVAMSVEKVIDKDHFIAFQDDVTQAMYISRASNLSYLILGASASSFTSGESSTFLRMSRNIDDGNATTTDEYISVKDFFASSTIDGGTFA